LLKHVIHHLTHLTRTAKIKMNLSVNLAQQQLITLFTGVPNE